MSEPFLSSDEYADRAHKLYHEGRYDEAIAEADEALWQIYDRWQSRLAE